jgi:hypothetical protein
MGFQVQFERLELKYAISEAMAQAIARAIEPHCEADSHNGRSGRGYPISSLYFDSHDLAFFRAKERSHHDRFKLRARTYQVGGQVNLEIKRKRGDVVWKQRAAVSPDHWIDAAKGFAPGPLKDKRQDEALERFACMLAQYGAEPKLVVEYDREAYAARTGEYARVTFDRHVRVHATEQWCLHDPHTPRIALNTGTTDCLGGGVILELKAEQFMPPWMADVIRSFELLRVGFSKYNTGMRAELDSIFVRDPLLWETHYA